MQYSFVAAVIFAAVSIHANPIILPTSQSAKQIGTRGIPDEHMCAANVGTTTWMPLADFDMARSSFCEQATDREIPLGESFSQVVGTWDLAAGKKKSEYVLGKITNGNGLSKGAGAGVEPSYRVQLRECMDFTAAFIQESSSCVKQVTERGGECATGGCYFQNTWGVTFCVSAHKW